MKILVTGADGMVARAAVKHCRSIGDSVVAHNRTSLDITDADAVLATINAGGFDAVINCAAFTDVDGAESDQARCYEVNAKGVENLAVACRLADAKLVTISTDYVFDGAMTGFYSEDDAPNPLGEYGRSKLEGERLAATACPDSAVVRSGWIFGHRGTNFLSVMHRLLSEGKMIKAIRDSYGTPTYAGDLAIRLRELAGSEASGIFHVVNEGGGTSYLGFAKEICRAGDFDPGLIQSVDSADLQRPAPRPLNSKMKSVRDGDLGFRPLPDWTDAIRRFIGSEKK